jgi:hypothetical protein
MGCLFWLPNEPVFWSPDEGGRYLDMRQIASTHRVRNPLPYPGRILDPALNNVPLIYWMRENGYIYSWWPSTFPAISSFPYQFFGLRGVLLIPIMSSLLTSYAVYRAVSSASRPLALIAMTATALASSLAFYAFTLWEHTLETLLLFLACASILRGWSGKSLIWFALAGLLAGVSNLLRIEAVVFFGGIVATAILRPFHCRGSKLNVRYEIQGLLCFLGFYFLMMTPLLLSGPYDGFHSLDKHYKITQRILESQANWRHNIIVVLPTLFFGSSKYSGLAFNTWLQWAATITTLFCAIAPLWVRRKWAIIYCALLVFITVSSSVVLLDNTTYLSVHGLVTIVPYIVLFSWSLQSRNNLDSLLWGHLALFTLTTYVLISIIMGWEGQGGLQWGPRYALPIMPIVIVAVFRGLKQMTKRSNLGTLLKGFVVVCFAFQLLISVGFQVRGLRIMKYSKEQLTIWQQEIEALPENALLITSSSALALHMPSLFESRILLHVSDKRPLPSDWSERATDIGLTSICRVSEFSETSCSAIRDY